MPTSAQLPWSSLTRTWPLQRGATKCPPRRGATKWPSEIDALKKSPKWSPQRGATKWPSGIDALKKSPKQPSHTDVNREDCKLTGHETERGLFLELGDNSVPRFVIQFALWNLKNAFIKDLVFSPHNILWDRAFLKQVQCYKQDGIVPWLLQASPLTVLLFAPYPQPCRASDKEQIKALVEHPINVHENTVKTHEFGGVGCISI